MKYYLYFEFIKFLGPKAVQQSISKKHTDRCMHYIHFTVAFLHCEYEIPKSIANRYVSFTVLFVYCTCDRELGSQCLSYRAFLRPKQFSVFIFNPQSFFLEFSSPVLGRAKKTITFNCLFFWCFTGRRQRIEFGI